MNLLRLTTILTAAVLLLTRIPAQGVPAYPGPIQVTQPDGSQLTIRIYGDEFFHYKTTRDGYNVVQQPDGFYYYATLAADGSMKATAVKARDARHRSAEDNAVLGRAARGVPAGRAAAGRAQAKAEMNREAPASPVHPSLQRALTSAEPFRSLVILVNFPDCSFRVSNPQQAFTDLLNQDGYSVGGADGSAWNYYHDNSNKRFNPQFVVTGPYTLPHNMAYYGGNAGGRGSDANPWQMARDACDAAYRAGVDFSQFAENGVARDIFIYYAGYNEAEGGPDYTIWPHRSYIHHTVGGIAVSGYACSSELKGPSGTTMASIGTFCHEFGHVMGWPDMYDTNYEENGQATALDIFSLMASGSYNNDSRTPPAVNILERSMVGWAHPTTIAKAGSYTLGAVEDDNGFRINTSNPDEYYLFENRQSGKYPWDRFFTSQNGTGMVVYHVDQSQNYVSGYTAAMLWQINQLNAYADHECMKIMKAYDGYRNAWFFPGARGVTEFTSKGSPAFAAWNGDAVGLDMKDIAVNNKIVSFRLANSGVAQIGGTVTNMRREPQKGVQLTLTGLGESAPQQPGVLSCAPQAAGGVYQTVSDWEGRFKFSDVSPGAYRLAATAEGYEEYVQDISVLSTTYDIEVVLKTPEENRAQMYSYYIEYVNSVGMPNGEPLTVAAQWDYADLKALAGDTYKLVGEEFYVTTQCAASAVVYIDDRLVCTQAVQPSVGGWTYVDLSDRDIEVTAGQSIKVGLTVSGYTGYPVAIDSKRNDKGSCILYAGSWGTDNYTWAIRAYFAGNGAATGITLDKTAIETFNGEEIKFAPTLEPAGSGGTVEWTSDNASVAEPVADRPGYVRTLAPGTARITATVKETGASATCLVTVKDEISGQLRMQINSPDDIQLEWTPAAERDEWTVSWNEQGTAGWEVRSTDNTEYHISGLKADTRYNLRVAGKRYDNGIWGYRSATFSTSDVQYIEEIRLPEEIVTVPQYSSTVEPEISPISATSRELTWSTDDPQIASVDQNGVLTGVKKGQTTLTVRAKFGGASASCTVRVENEPADYVVTAYQNDAVISWKAVMHKGSWKVTCKKDGGETAESVTDTTMVYLPLLTPGARYEVTVQSVDASGTTGVPTSTAFTTSEIDSPYASMYGIKGTYAAGEKVQLTLVNIDGQLQEVRWTADGRKVSPPEIVLPAGEHTLKAAATLNGGHKQVFMKKITVN